MSKRGREDLEENAEVAEAAMELGSTVGRGLDVKLMALDRVKALIDVHDDLYTNQKALVDADAPFHLVELLSDESTAVAVRAAQVIALMTEHSSPCRSKLQSGPLPGLESSLSKVMLNPVQGEFIDAGAVGKLVPWLTVSVEQQSNAARDALTNICSYNLEGKLACLSAFLELLLAKRYQVLAVLDDVIGSIDSQGDDVIRLMEQLIDPVMEAVRSLSGKEGLMALTVLGSLCEVAPLVAEKAQNSPETLEVAANYLLNGTLQAQDTAARTLWNIVAPGDGYDVLSISENGTLGKHAEAMARNLEVLIEKSLEDEEKDDNQRENAKNGSDDEGYVVVGGAATTSEEAVVEEVCFAEEAKQLLKALAAANPEVDIGSTIYNKSSCCIM